MERCRSWWSGPVCAAFWKSLADSREAEVPMPTSALNARIDRLQLS
jgi:hypothetical protein